MRPNSFVPRWIRWVGLPSESALRSLPFDNLWLRADEFGIHATASRSRKLMFAASELARLGHPIVLDQAGGFPALVAAAFGVIGGLAHGIANQGEQFKSYGLRTPPQRNGRGGGSSKWVYLAPIDHYLKESKLAALFAVRGAKAHLICTDSSCCPLGVGSMRTHPKRHALRQRVHQLEEMSRTPEQRRSEHLLRYGLLAAGQHCRMLERIPAIASSEFGRVFHKQARHLDDLAQLVENLLPQRHELTRSSEPIQHRSIVMPQVSGL